MSSRNLTVNQITTNNLSTNNLSANNATITGTLLANGNGKASYYATTTQSIGPSTNTVVLFPGINFNTFGSNLTYSSGTFTNGSGSTLYIQINYNFRLNGAAGSGWAGNGWIYVNGTGPFYGQVYTPNTFDNQSGISGSAIIALTAGSYFQILAYQTYTGAISISNNATYLASGVQIYQLI